MEVVNEAMIKIQELDVKKPKTYIAHRSKLRLAKKMGQKDTDPLFKLPRLPKSKMDQLSQELEEFELPSRNNQNFVIDEFCEENYQSQGGDDSTCLSRSVSSKTGTSEDGMSENRSSDEFLSFHQSTGSGGSEASNPEQEFSRHFNLDDLEPAALNQALQDSSAEEEEPV